MTSATILRPLLAGLVTAFCCAFASPASAQEWERLTPRERYERMQRYREYENLPPDRRQDIDKRYERWRQLPDDKRKKVLRNYRRYQQMPPAERRQFDRKYDRWRQEYRGKSHRSGGPPKGRDGGVERQPRKKNKNR